MNTANIETIVLSIPFTISALIGFVLSTALAFWIYFERVSTLANSDVVVLNYFQRQIAGFVTLGVAMTGLLAGPLIGWTDVVVLALLFVVTGFPQYIGAALYNGQVDRHNMKILQAEKARRGASHDTA